jgi:hypothetical protein
MLFEAVCELVHDEGHPLEVARASNFVEAARDGICQRIDKGEGIAIIGGTHAFLAVASVRREVAKELEDVMDELHNRGEGFRRDVPSHASWLMPPANDRELGKVTINSCAK